MGISLRDFNSLDPVLVRQTLLEVLQRLQEANPTVDVRFGAVHNLVAYPHAILDTQRRQNIMDYESSRSLRVLFANPALADTDLVDDILSNFLVSRTAGSEAFGTVTMVVSDNVTVVIPQGATFTGNGQEFVTENVFTAKAEASQIVDDTDRLLVAQSNGNYAFTFPVVATAKGAASRLAKDMAVVPTVLPQGYVSSYASEDFSGGTDDETTSSMLARLQEGVAAKVLAGRTQMRAVLRNSGYLEVPASSSIVGLGDPELTRSQRGILPINVGGRVDWYVRTAWEYTVRELALTAVLVSIGEDQYGTWQVTIGKDAAPGFFEIQDLWLTSDAEQQSAEIITTTKSFDLSTDSDSVQLPDVVNATEAAYSRYQTAIIQFRDTSRLATGMSVGDQDSYTAAVAMLPDIDTIQDNIASDRSIAPLDSDILVRAPVPCFVSVSLTINKRADTTGPNVDYIKTAVALVINRIPFQSNLYSSSIYSIVHRYLTDGATVGSLVVRGKLIDLNGNITWLTGPDLLIPSYPERQISGKTVQFFTRVENIAVNVVNAITPSY